MKTYLHSFFIKIMLTYEELYLVVFYSLQIQGEYQKYEDFNIVSN